MSKDMNNPEHLIDMLHFIKGYREKMEFKLKLILTEIQPFGSQDKIEIQKREDEISSIEKVILDYKTAEIRFTDRLKKLKERHQRI